MQHEGFLTPRGALFSFVTFHDLFDLCGVETALRTRTCTKCLLAPSIVNRVVAQDLVRGFRHDKWKFRIDAAQRLSKIGVNFQLAHSRDQLARELHWARAKLPPWTPSLLCVKGDKQLIAAIVSSFPKDVDKDNDGDAYDFHLDVLHAIGFASERGDASVRQQLLQQLQINDCSILRCAALNALVEIGEQGDAFAVALAQDCLEDQDEDLRASAVNALRVLSKPGDQHVTTTLATRLDIDDDEDVRLAAVEALKETATTGDGRVIGSLSRRIRDDNNQEIRLEALEALKTLVLPNCTCTYAVDALTEVIADDDDIEVRREALEMIQSIAKHGDQKVCAACLACLASDDENLRCTAVTAVACVAKKGDSDALQALIMCLAFPQATNVLRELVDAVHKIAWRGDRLAVSILGKLMLEDICENSGVHLHVGCALVDVAAKGDPFVLAVFAGCLRSKESHIRQHGIESLCAFIDAMDKSDESWFPVITAHINDEDEYVAELCREMLKRDARLDSEKH